MKINDRYEIKSDTLNVTLLENYWTKETEDKPSELVQKVIGYYSTPKQALTNLVLREVMGTGMHDLETVVEKINLLSNDINNMNI